MITLTMTTCQRYDLFTSTIKSFAECCVDSHLISKIIVVDDQSPLNEVEMMTEQLQDYFNADVNMIRKPESQKGHQHSLNILYDKIETDIILHLEDDWLFTKKDYIIYKALSIMEIDPSIKQVLFRTADIMARNQTVIKSKYFNMDEFEYQDFEYVKYNYTGTFNKDIKNRPAWCGWNLNPALWNFKEIKKLGKFPVNQTCFEYNYSKHFWQRGYKVAYFPESYCTHIGGANSAYRIKNTKK